MQRGEVVGVLCLASLRANRVQCWGSNRFSQLGKGSIAFSLTPVTVTGLNNTRALASSGNHTCAVTDSGMVKCWGWNLDGQLGNGGTTDSITPVLVPGISTVTALAASSYHTCAITGDGTVKCWGSNGDGRFGNGEVDN